MGRYMMILALALIAGACDSTTDLDVVKLEQLGEIGSDPKINVAVDDRDIRVTVRTFGNGCVSRGPTEVSIHEAEIDIMPFDTVSYLSASPYCIDIFRAFDHVADIRVQNARTYTATISGVVVGGLPDTITVSREITVR